MTENENEWDTCKDPSEMYSFVGYLPRVIRSKAGRRKLRLFGVACCRKLGKLVSDPRSVSAIEVAERLADGLASREEVSSAKKAAWDAWEESWERHLNSTENDSEWLATPYEAAQSVRLLLDNKAGNFGAAGMCYFPTNRDARDYRSYRKRGDWQADVLRCIFGNPFRPVSMDPGWRTPAVQSLALAAYENPRRLDMHLEPERLGILADALEEAVCTNSEMLAHLRKSGPHVRGCWVVDLALAKT